MADYFSQTVVRPDIPLTAMTALEHAALAQIFDEECLGETAYFSAGHGPSDFVILEIAEVRALLERDDGIASMLADVVRKQLADLDPVETELEIDLSMTGFEGIFQDVVRRSALDYIEIEAAWTCSKMRSDGFGGAATLITGDDIEWVSTAEWLEKAIARLMGEAPG